MLQPFFVYPACGHCDPQLLLCGHFIVLPPFTYAGGVLNNVSKSKEPQSGHGMRFSDFSVIVALMI